MSRRRIKRNMRKRSNNDIKILMQLRADKKKLSMLAKRLEEQRRIKKEIKALKKKTRKGVIGALTRANNPETRKEIKKGWRAFQRFADRHGD